ncbi:MAG: hypothetical protein RL026_2047 [Pseudomonadota bacterium]
MHAIRNFSTLVSVATLALLAACGAKRETITGFEQLAGGKQFAVPTGTVADQLVTSAIPDAKFLYFNTVLDAALAVKAGKADAAAYDEPILRNIAGKNPGLTVISRKITVDNYGFAARLDDAATLAATDAVISEINADGRYAQMLQRWLPAAGAPAAMPALTTAGEEVLRFGTAAVTEPFSFVDGSQQVVGLDVEIATLVAQKLGKRLEIVNMEFGALIPALAAGKVDLIGACITITPERAKSVAFSKPYYQGGIAALVRAP